MQPITDADREQEFDELDPEFESSDEEDRNVFKIRDALEVPTTRNITARSLHSLIHEGLIDLMPEYQRDVVWPESKMVHLIDSIFRNFYIPPIIFAVHTDEGVEVRVCVDGKQRLTSIQKFFDGQIPHRDNKTKKSYWYTRPESQRATRLEVPDEYKKRFAEKTITCVEYHGIAPGTEREIFQRVQLGMSLTGAEKLQAIDSPWATMINKLQNSQISNESGLAQVLEWDTKRGRDFQCLAQFIYCCDGLPKELIPTHQKMEKFLSRTDLPSSSFRSAVNDVLNEFYYIATEKSLKMAFTKIPQRIAPVEFVFIGVLLYMLRQASHEDRARATLNLRLYARKHHQDIRSNSAVAKTMWHFIAKVSENPSGSHSVSEMSLAKPRKKRKTTDDSSDDEYRPSYRTRGR